MRRLITLAAVIGLMSLAGGASAHGTEHIKDRFNSISWGGSDGSLPWAGPWSEIGDDGDEKKGNVRVVSSGDCPGNICMRISGLLSGHGAGRTADTSMLEDIRLRYDVKNVVTLLPIGLTQLQVQVNDGGGWDTVANHNLGSDIDKGFEYEGIPSSEQLSIRFRITGLAMTSVVHVDNVEITGSHIEETTTTTSTTSTTSTTTTTLATTTTTRAPTNTTTTKPTTTTSVADGSGGAAPNSTSTTTTTIAGTTSTVGAGGSPGGTGGTTTSTTTSATTTTIPAAGPGSGPGGGGAMPDGSGIRAAARGIQANFQSDLYGDVRTVTALNGVDFRADYNMAVEVIEASWGWIVVLGIVMAFAIVSGLDRRRRPLEA